MTTTRAPLLGEWACLGAVYDRPSHGFAVSKRLALDGDLGRVWHVSRPLTYRAFDRLRGWGWIEACGREVGSAGPERTLLRATRAGRSRLRAWIATPVDHVRDVRTELLLKVILADEIGLDVGSMLALQCERLDALAASITASSEDGAKHARADEIGEDASRDDLVVAWRREMTLATQRFVSDLARRYQDQRR